MPYQDFRQFLSALREHGELIDIDRPMNLRSDIGKALKQSYERQGPALQFNSNGTAMPIVAGLYSTRAKALLAFEATEDTIYEKVVNGLDHPIDPVGVEGPAPCQEIVLTGTQIDLGKLPVPTYSPADGGPYITAGIIVSKDPETGIPDVGHYRFQILDGKRMSFLAQPFHRFGKHLAKCRKLGVKPQAAILIGVDPIIAYTCQVQSSDTTNDWCVAGGLRGAPVELVNCRTIDLQVPATAEVVIEFEVDLDETAMEGPLGEYTGYYTPASEKPIARVTAITHRHDPIFQGLLTGKPVTENHILKEIPFEASVWRTLKAQFPTLERVAIPASGGVSFYVVLSIRPRYEGEARQAIMAAMALNIRPKWVIAVEPDINIFNPAEVEWAMCFRTRPSHDVFVVDHTPAGPLDPSVDDHVQLAARESSTVGIDATRAFGSKFPDVADVPGWQDFPMPELDAHRA
jgi:4-hydroxy-3-polyprenylbenzoate decarboxylase/2,5-furandicarboxylate decarboxylase 1